MEAGEATNESSRLVGGGGGQMEAEPMKRPKQTTRLRCLGPWLSVKRIKKIKKTHLGPKRRQTRRLGPVSSSWACVGLLGCCGPSWAFVGLVRANERCGRGGAAGVGGGHS